MVDPQLLTACGLLAVGTYAIRLAGTASKGIELPAKVDRGLEQSVAVLLAAVAATSTLFDGQDLADWTRTAGVLAGVTAAILRLPLILIVLIAGLATALLRLVT
ncbi:AzlD domain-containing protein [Microbacterium sp.]|uniref:AzlD domain-containing protein n=1 Tax=Microbacterium sp. TaxID=51671 RepID=UPI0039E2D46A